MSLRARLHASEFLGAFREGVRKLSKSPGKTFPTEGPASGTLRPWIILLAGIGLGTLGYTTVSKEARMGWLTTHSPPRALWERTLHERGFQLVTDEGTLMRLRGELPYLHATAPRVHILESRRAVFLATGQDLLLFTLHSRNPPSFLKTDWEALGYGWDAYESLLGIEFPMAVPPPIMSQRSRRATWRSDPREIRY